MNRRDVLTGVAAGAALSAMGRSSLGVALAEEAAPVVFAPRPGAWKSYELTTTLELQKAAGASQAWVPIPAFTGGDWMRPGETTWTSPTGKGEIVVDRESGARMLHIVWPDGEAKPTATITSRFSSRDHAADLTAKSDVTLKPEERKRYLAATELLPLTGIVKETADKITAGAKDDIDKARRIYEWVVDNTFRDPKTRGCGLGDIESMLRTGNLSGKCADLNALYVGLARASALPARDLYGIRVVPSAFGYKSLGAKNEVITKAQHCRAEVFIAGLGWVPADPADVRKVVLEEPPGNLALTDAKVLAARKVLFGAWESNWLAYNDAHDVTLPGSKGPKVGFLMYPQAETAGARLDPLDADAFTYKITAAVVPG